MPQMQTSNELLGDPMVALVNASDKVDPETFRRLIVAAAKKVSRDMRTDSDSVKTTGVSKPDRQRLSLQCFAKSDHSFDRGVC